MKRRVAFFVGLTAASLASASVPTGAYFGAWHVVSITSVSGDGSKAEGDASAMITQEQNCDADGSGCDEIRVRWDQGQRISVSARFQGCYGHNEDLEAVYQVPVVRWLKSPRFVERQVALDFKAWTDQAVLSCENPIRAKAFRLADTKKALRSFSERVAYLNQ